MTAKQIKPTFSKFKKQLRAYSAHWISGKDEKIVGLLKNYHSNSIMFTYGIAKGLLEIKDGGKYDNFHFTDKGITILENLKMTTCAFSGRTLSKKN